MIQITPQMRIWVAVEPVDFRRGIDGLSALCRQQLKADPRSGALFVFGSRRRKSIKILVDDGQGFVLYQKRLSSGRFGWWAPRAEQPVLALDAHQLQVLLWNGNPLEVKTAPMWRRLHPAAA